MREEQLNQKKPGFNDLGNSQFIQIATNVKMKRSTAIKTCCRGKAEDVASHHFDKTSERLRGQNIGSHKLSL